MAEHGFIGLPQDKDGKKLHTTQQVYEGDTVHNQLFCLSDPDNLGQLQRVDNQGQAYIRFAEGNPMFDAFGKMQVSESTTIREYLPTGAPTFDNFEVTLAGAGATQFNSTRMCHELTTGTLSGDLCRHRTHLHHKYQVGVATTALFSGMMDSSSKVNCHKRLGIFDDSDGLFFHSDGNSELGVVLRSSTSGSVVETHIHQTEWNTDKLNGAGGILNISGFTLDPTKTQVFFIDYQWLGAGRVRFGFVIDGRPIVVHQMYHSNNMSVPYMRTGTLPLTFEIENTGPVASPNTLSLIAASVKCEGKFTPRELLFGGSLPAAVTIDSSVNYTPIASFRAKQTLTGGIDNRAVILPTKLSISEITTTNKPWLFELVKDDSLVGGTFDNAFPNSAIEMNGAVTESTGGDVLMSWIVTGEEHISLLEHFNFYSELVIRKATITDEPSHYTLRAKAFDATSIQAVMAFNWKEIR